MADANGATPGVTSSAEGGGDARASGGSTAAAGASTAGAGHGAGAGAAGATAPQGGASGSGRPLFRVRTVTTGVELDRDESRWAHVLGKAVAFNAAARARLETLGYEVQTVRITTNPYEEYLDTSSHDTLRASAKRLCEALARAGGGAAGTLLNIGPCTTPGVAAEALPSVLIDNEPLFASMRVGCEAGVPSAGMVAAAASTVLQLSTGSAGGEACFKFGATFNCQPGIPFFPAGFHEGPRSFAVGLENTGLVFKAFSTCKEGDMAAAAQHLHDIMEAALVPLDKECQRLAGEHCIQYDGIDTSIAPATDAPLGETLVDAYEKLLGAGRFGGAGTLTVSSLITRVCKGVNVKTCGYSGLMLPPLEDRGLALRASEGKYGLQDLLLFSSVCGLGLDAVPIPGDVSKSDLRFLFSDVCSMAFRLNKPLACRLFPVKAKRAGDLASFDNPHLCDAPILALR